jgi:hypothetical protein
VRRRTAAWAVAASLVLSACGIGMPDSGKVTETSTTGSNRDDQPANIDPPRPKKGASPDDIVNGFLEAMTESPAVGTSVAREFLTEEASVSWKPTGLVTYGGVLTPRGSNSSEVKLIDADRIDERGAWLGPLSEDDSTIKFSMETEGGEWRIARPPPYVIVPQTWFEQRFQQVSLYFFDPSGKVLVPEPVFVPRGRQFASKLVELLLQGPSPGLTEQSYLPPGVHSVVSVPVLTSGVAQVDLNSDDADAVLPSSDHSEQLVSQLAWTLQQDPAIERFRVFIDGQPVQLEGETEFSVEHGYEYAPYVSGSSTQLFGLEDGLMVGGGPDSLTAVTGPFGQAGYDLRSVSPDLHAEQVAAVSTSGSTLWLGSVKDTGTDPTELLNTGEDLLRPVWDFSGRIWEVDRRKSGAVVYYLRDGKMRVLHVQGISGQDVKDFLVSRDGSRLIAVIRKDATYDSIVVSRILTTGDGQVAQALAADEITDPANPEGQIRDIAWRSPTSVAVLRPVIRELFQIKTTSVDGSSALDSIPVTIDGDVLALAGTPIPDETIYAFAAAAAANDTPAHAELRDLAGARADQIDLDPGVTMLSYVS